MFNKLQKTTIWVSQAEWQTKEDYCYTILALFFLIDKAELPNSKLQETTDALIRPCLDKKVFGENVISDVLCDVERGFRVLIKKLIT
jgi:hypothetical protein